MDRIQEYISHLQQVLSQLSVADVRASIDLIMMAYENDQQIFIVGNWGSASTATHISCDLSKGTVTIPGGGVLPGLKRFRVISLTDNVATMSAWANDTTYDDIFVEQLKNLVCPNDLLLCISVSGNSENVLRAMRLAKQMDCRSIAWTGQNGGEMAELADVTVCVGSDRYGPVEDVHLILNHILHAWISAEIQAVK